MYRTVHCGKQKKNIETDRVNCFMMLYLVLYSMYMLLLQHVIVNVNYFHGNVSSMMQINRFQFQFQFQNTYRLIRVRKKSRALKYVAS